MIIDHIHILYSTVPRLLSMGGTVFEVNAPRYAYVPLGFLCESITLTLKLRDLCFRGTPLLTAEFVPQKTSRCGCSGLTHTSHASIFQFPQSMAKSFLAFDPCVLTPIWDGKEMTAN